VTVIAGNLCGNYTLSLETSLNECISIPCTYPVNIVDTESPQATGSLQPFNAENCTVGTLPPVATTVAALEAMGVAITDNCTG
jgi:hypothetical protein